MQENWFAKILDRVGTALALPERGWSERANNNQPTKYTGYTPQSQAAGLDDWRRVHFDTPKGGGGQVLPASTQNTNPLGGGGTQRLAAPTGGAPTGGGIDEAELARRARENRINSAKAQAGQLRGEAQGIFDTILQAVGKFRERNKSLFDTAGQEITNNASEILGSNARTAQEAAGSARARGRALGLGDSSKFNLQNKVQGNLASTQGSTIARRGEEERNNQNLFQERQDQAQNQENEANTYLRSANERAGVIERAGLNTADEVYDNALNDIVNYQRQLAAINPVRAGGLTQYTPNFSGTANTINGVLNGVGGGRGVTEQDMGNPVNPTDIFSLLRRRGLVQG